MRSNSSRLKHVLPSVTRRMRRVRRQGTAPERELRRLLRKHRILHRCNVSNLPGSPDVMLRNAPVVIFVHGCFWHRHHCSAGQSLPRTHRVFWEAKFAENIQRDQRQRRALARLGFRVVVVWECQLKRCREASRAAIVRRIEKSLLTVGRCLPSTSASTT
jgi:DNA mismatch endonuclease (patch repair protein)